MSLSKILHLYWGRNQPLSYFRYLTVKSFVKYHPEWAVRVWISKESVTKNTPWKTGEHSGAYTGKDYLNDLSPYLFQIDLPIIGIPNNIPEVHKSDLLRWYLLGTYGGIWSDFDILYTGRLHDWLIGTGEGVGLCRYELPYGKDQIKYFQAIGFLMSSGYSGHEFFTQMFHRGLGKIPQTEYQAFGATMLENEQLPRWELAGKTVSYIDKNLVYPYCSHDDVQNYFKPVQLQISNSIGLHWYAGHPVNGPMSATITEENIREKANEYSICREALKVI